MKELKLFVITDTHFFKNSLGAYGEEYDRFMDFEQKCFAETENINKAAFEYLAASDEADIVLIAGDLSFNGEKESNIAFSGLLKDFQEKSGKRVYVVTAGHDFNDHPFAFDNTGRLAPEGTKFSELYDLYKDFGYTDAIAFNKEHMSYVANLSDDVRLISICNDIDGKKNIEYDAEFLGWIEAQAKQAQADGKVMIAMEHYPVLAGQPLLNIIADARQKGSAKLVSTLADNGVHLIFTGHMHNQSINVVETEKGNKFYDVCTGSLIGCPAFMRLVTIKDEHTVDIKSIPVPEFEWEKGNRTGEQYLQDQFDRMIKTMISAIENDPKRFCGKINAAYKPAMDKPMRMIGRKISTITLGTIGKLLCIKVDKSIRKVKFADFAIDVARYVFVGNQPYVEGTPEGDVLLRLFKRIHPFLKTFKGSQGEVYDSYELLKHTIGNYGIDDYNAEIKF